MAGVALFAVWYQGANTWQMPGKISKSKTQEIITLSQSNPELSRAALARETGVSRGTIRHILASVSAPMSNGSRPAGQTGKIIKPRTPINAGAWSLEDIRHARDEQMRGRFEIPARMAEAMRTNYALFTALGNRIDPSSSLDTELVPHDSTRGRAARDKAARYVSVSSESIKNAHECLVNHGVAFFQICRGMATDDTGFTTYSLRYWPIEFVRFNPTIDVYETRTMFGPTVPIVHGDGEWAIVTSLEYKPFTFGCILSAALVWGSNAYGMSDWNANARSHGIARMIGELPDGYQLTKADGTLTEDASAFLRLMTELVGGESPAGIIPPGSKANFVANNSTAWQIFNQLIITTDKAAARIYQGTDATLGSVGGAPGVDIATLFGVATTKVQSDLAAIERAINTGVYAPWTEENFGDARLAPKMRYKIPDPDADRKSAEEADREERLFKSIERRRGLGLNVDQDIVDQLAQKFGVKPAPQLAAATDARPAIALAPTDVAKVVTVDEARASQGLPKIGGEVGAKMISELDAPPAGGGFAP